MILPHRLQGFRPLALRILVVTNLYPPQNLGGFGLCLERLAAGLGACGHQLRVLSSDQPYLGAAGDQREVIRSLSLLGSYEGGLSNLSAGSERAHRQRQNQQQLQDQIQQWQPDAALVGNLDLLGIDLLEQLLEAGVRCIQHVGFLSPPFPLERYPWRHRQLYGMAFASREVKRALVQQGFPVESDPVVHPPLAPSMATVDASVGSRDGAPLRVGYSGLLMASKGVHRLLEAAALLRKQGYQLELLLAGKTFSPDYAAQLSRYCEQQGLTPWVRWLGFVEPEQLSNFYQHLDVLVFPSIFPESFGMVVAEAMAHGVVPISTGVGGAVEVITHGRNGLLVQPDQAESIATALQQCLQQPRPQLRQLGARAQQDARRAFTTEICTRPLDRWLTGASSQ